ncbi:MAG TPA: COQ9 family protein [Sphingomicrobium sp.]|nr:COQ9 family protein [Sphingomicrobium sp.]
MESPPLELLRRELALAVGENAVFDGWSRKAVDSAAAQLGIDPVQARLAIPKAPTDMIGLYIEEVDRALEAYFTNERLAGMKIREKIRALVWRRLEIMGPAREAVRRALAVLAMPHNLPIALKISWQTADRMWRIAGDNSTDFNHYTKRMTLGALYGSTLLIWIDDESEGLAETAAFIDRRIDDIMKFEKFKADWRGSSEHLSLSRFLGRLRYPPR